MKSKVTPNDLLFKAIQEKNIENIQQALILGADLEAKDSSGRTPLYLTLVYHDDDFLMAHLMLEQGSDVNARSTDEDWMPLHWACFHAEIDVLSLLIEHGADVNGLAKGDIGTPLHATVCKVDDPNLVARHAKAADFLLAMGADPTIKNEHGQTPVEMAKLNHRDDVGKVIDNYYNQIRNEKRLEIFNRNFITYKARQLSPNLLNLELDTSMVEQAEPLVTPQVIRAWLNIPTTLDKQNQALIKHALNISMRTLAQPERAIIALRLDICVAYNIFNQLEKTKLAGITPDTLSELVFYVQGLLNQHKLQAQALSKRMISTTESVNQQVYKIVRHLQQVEQQLDTWFNQIYSTIPQIPYSPSATNALPAVIKEIKTAFHTVENFKGNIRDVLSFSETLFAAARKVADEVDLGLEQLQRLKINLDRLLANPPSDRFVLVKAEVEFKKAQIAYNKKLLQLNNTLRELEQGIYFASVLAGLMGAAKYAEQIIIIGSSTINIVKNIASIGAIAAMSGCTMPEVNLAEVINSILDAQRLLAADSSEEQKILEKISKQIEKLAKQMDARFEQIEKILGIAHEGIYERFDRLESILNIRFGYLEELLISDNAYLHLRFDKIEKVLTQFYTKSIQELHQIKNIANQIDDTMNNISQQIGELEKKFDSNTKALYKQPYVICKEKALNLKTFTILSERQNKADGCAGELKVWATVFAKEAVLAGDDTRYTNKKIDPDKAAVEAATLCEKAREQGIGNIVNLLARYANTNLHLKLREGLANPLVWADAARTYMKMYALTEKIYLYDGYETDIEKMKKVGQELNSFITNIQTNHKLFVELCNDYCAAAKHILSQLKNHDFGSTLADNQFKSTLKNLDTVYQLLIIYTGLAFSTSNLLDKTLRNNVRTWLWNKADMQKYIGSTTSQEHKDFLYIAIKKNVLKAIKGIEEQLLTRLAEKKVEIDKGIEKAGHPFILEMLDELEYFKVTGQLINARLNEAKHHRADAQTISSTSLDEASYTSFASAKQATHNQKPDKRADSKRHHAMRQPALFNKADKPPQYNNQNSQTLVFHRDSDELSTIQDSSHIPDVLHQNKR